MCHYEKFAVRSETNEPAWYEETNTDLPSIGNEGAATECWQWRHHGWAVLLYVILTPKSRTFPGNGFPLAPPGRFFLKLLPSFTDSGLSSVA